MCAALLNDAKTRRIPLRKEVVSALRQWPRERNRQPANVKGSRKAIPSFRFRERRIAGFPRRCLWGDRNPGEFAQDESR